MTPEKYSQYVVITVMAIIILVGLGSAVTCAGTGVRRDRTFEDACRKAGGVVVDASTITTASAGGTKQACVEVVQAPTAKPIPLPNYTP